MQLISIIFALADWLVIASYLSIGSAIATLVICGGMYYLGRLRVMFYLLETTSNEYLKSGIDLRLITYSQIIPIIGIIAWILSLIFVPDWSLLIFVMFFLLPSPLYMKSAPSGWKYWSGVGYTLSDPHLDDLRALDDRARKKALRLVRMMCYITTTLVHNYNEVTPFALHEPEQLLVPQIPQ